MGNEMLTLNWNEARTWNEGQVRDYFAAKGWALSGDDAQLGETQLGLSISVRLIV